MSGNGASPLELDIYGLAIRVECAWTEVADAIRDDFAWFATGRSGDGWTLRVEQRKPDFDALGDVAATFVTPRNTVYRNGTRTLVDYFGRAATVVDPQRRRVTIQGEDVPLVHEAAYQFVLSRAGEHLDATGLTRLHALGIVGRQGAVALMLPSGGGKTRMALSALGDADVRLLSEDTPLIDRRGCLHPFPLRIGVNEGDAERLPAGRRRRVERMEFHPKVLLALEAIADRIETAPQPLAHLVLGRRSLGRDARLEHVRRGAAVGPLLREAVVGVGVYQGMEFVLQRGARDVLAKGGVAARRAAHCAAGLARAQVWRLTLGRDAERNWHALEPLLR